MALTYVVGQGLKTVASSGSTVYTFEASGEIELPVETAIGGLRYNPSAFTIGTAKIMAKSIGTAQYNVKIVSYDNTGANEITHINTTVTLSAQDTVPLTISTASVGGDRQLELKLTKQTGTPSTDITVYLA